MTEACNTVQGGVVLDDAIPLTIGQRAVQRRLCPRSATTARRSALHHEKTTSSVPREKNRLSCRARNEQEETQTTPTPPFLLS